MFAINNLVRSGLHMSRLAGQCRTVMGAPPRVILSLPEKCAHAAILVVGVLGIPAYVACNFKNYGSRAE